MDDTDETIMESFPRWKEALKLFHAAGFKPGDVVTHEWLYDAFAVDRPGPTTPYADAQKATLAYLGQFKPFQDSLLSDCNIDLATVPGVGYKITPPAEQTGDAYRDGMNDIRKGMRKMGRRLVHVDTTALTDEQRRENANALAKLSMLQTMRSRVSRLAGPEAEIAHE